MVVVASDRHPHWIKLNHQCRIPSRWVAFDTESKAVTDGDTETQTWAMGAAFRWRTDLQTGDHAQAQTFNNARDMWAWIDSFCRRATRTIAFAHNLGYDIRISQAMDILPSFGFALEWCNLDRNVSAITWRSDHGTLVLCDTWTWLPMPLETVAPRVGLRKLSMPTSKSSHYKWERYCLRDAEIVYRVASDLVNYIRSESLGNWQPTGAGMAYATWRHKFMAHKVLVHSDESALSAERRAMHTGRAEAWKHGELLGDTWTEVDLRNAYVTIAAQCTLPTKLKFKTGSISVRQYRSLVEHYRVLVHVHCRTNHPVSPYHKKGRTLWPVGTFNTWLWDTEANMALECGADIRIRDAYVYSSQPILREWALWVLSVLRSDAEDVSPIARTWLKHCSRALIGRLALRTVRWEEFGTNPFDTARITHMTDAETGEISRLMHIGNQTFHESARVEGKDSLPQVTGWVMAECRSRLWSMMQVAGEDNLAHVDTDSVLVNREGLARLRHAYAGVWADTLAVKGSANRVIVYGPRNYRFGRERKVAGVPRKAEEILPNVFRGEQWIGVSASLEANMASTVQVRQGKWDITVTDPRRQSGAGAGTVPYRVDDA